MINSIKTFLIAVICSLLVSFATYRLVMHSVQVAITSPTTVSITLFGYTDNYYCNDEEEQPQLKGEVLHNV